MESFWRTSCFFRQGQPSGITTFRTFCQETLCTISQHRPISHLPPQVHSVTEEVEGMRLQCACTEAASLSCMHDGVLARHSYMHCCENWLWGCPVARLGVPKVPCFKSSLTHLLLTYPFRSRWALHQQWTAPSWVALVMPPSFFLLCLLVEC